MLWSLLYHSKGIALYRGNVIGLSIFDIGISGKLGTNLPDINLLIFKLNLVHEIQPGNLAVFWCSIGPFWEFLFDFFRRKGSPVEFPYLSNPKLSTKVAVIGVDGMDPMLVRKFIAQGKLPTFEKLMRQGFFGPLATTNPPQSPVAWSSFISGCNPGGHGIYDFIHRDPKSFTPHLSTSRSFGSQRTVDIGKWSIPLSGGEVKLLRRGVPFWSVLEDNDIPASLVKLVP